MNVTEKDRRFLRAFGRAIRRARAKRRISQEQLGFLAGLDRTYIGGVERGERNVSVLNILRIASALAMLPSRMLAQCERDYGNQTEQETDDGVL